jgi:hypothetical protein
VFISSNLRITVMITGVLVSSGNVSHEDYVCLRARFIWLEIRQKMLSLKCGAGETKRIDLSALLFRVLVVSASRAFI